MRIEDLDEFDGLTADHVRDWLRAKGWERCPALDISCAECWRLGEGAKGTVWLGCTDKRVAKAVEQIARWAGISVQSLLREINPRMRAGWPSDDEIQRHLGGWIARDEIGVLRIGSFSEDEEDGRPLFIEGDNEGYRTQEEVKGWSFWPCDQHGNKTRRGA